MSSKSNLFEKIKDDLSSLISIVDDIHQGYYKYGNPKYENTKIFLDLLDEKKAIELSK